MPCSSSVTKATITFSCTAAAVISKWWVEVVIVLGVTRAIDMTFNDVLGIYNVLSLIVVPGDWYSLLSNSSDPVQHVYVMCRFRSLSSSI